MSSATWSSSTSLTHGRRFLILAIAALAAIAALVPAEAAGAVRHRPLAPSAVEVLPMGQSRFHLSWPRVRYAARYHVYNAGHLVGRTRRPGFTTGRLLRQGV